MEYTSVITVSAFAVIFLSALFLFIRNYPSDRWFSLVFVVAGGVLLWGACGAEAEAGDEVETITDNEVSESYTQNTNKN